MSGVTPSCERAGGAARIRTKRAPRLPSDGPCVSKRRVGCGAHLHRRVHVRLVVDQQLGRARVVDLRRHEDGRGPIHGRCIH
eukprot:5780902-Prymnesium_polylepis.1